MNGTASHTAVRWADGRFGASDETVADEVPVAMVYNGVSHAVMMASPGDLEELAIGFTLTEGIADRYADIVDVELAGVDGGIEARITLAQHPWQRLKAQRRQLAGRSGCGLCGAEHLQSALRPVARIDSNYTTDAGTLLAGLTAMAAEQPLNRATGSAHAAGWLGAGPLLVREDIGRHNAVDKLVGALRMQRRSDDGALLVTSRASYEIVHKAAAAGIPVIAAISGPTRLAIEMAESAGIALIGFTRDERLTVYSHTWRLDGPNTVAG
ncbi:formate dehydrogenase accessory sulfurtransferase FdhD [Jeongeupia naejangsanensis]|uniref:Sulfur carrier protein FdhD n=1 Tax=Jeongeupia naejangsanensis TaxID=613195 RepID=A0ABS2BP41_9NEIS|nr:formate dehydrogenase accessory sulfurtransferase FdhD [Jeongeupia naejangsanensis]MBM3117406.1 formate dehydrogenase accessory sulfurtransferase FdhD [Jeongeupia naejangsanensis]